VRAYRPVLAQPIFRRLFPGFVVSSVGDGMSVIAVGWLALELAAGANEGLIVGAAVAAYTLPGIVAGFALGGVFGGMSARRLLLLDSALRAASLGTIPVLALLGALTPITYVGILAVSSLLHAWGLAGRLALVAELLPEPQRLPANSLLTAQAHAAFIVGPAVAGVVIAVTGAAAVIAFDALTYAVLGILLWSTRADPAVQVEAAPPQPGLRQLVGHPALRGLLILTFVFYFLYGPVEVALPLYVARDLGGSAALLGWIWAGWGIGAVLGGLAVGALRRVPLWPAAAAIVVGWGLALLPLALLVDPAVAIVAFSAGGFIFAPYPALAASLLQREAPPGALAAVSAAWNSMLLAATPVGTALGGPLVAVLGARGTLLASAAATLALGAGYSLLLARQRQASSRKIVTRP
jgi:predicted MFS family arabinose efflux permease